MSSTKDEMARTFLALADRYGYRRATVEEVAARCRISKKTLYEAFESKAAVHIDGRSQSSHPAHDVRWRRATLPGSTSS